MKGIFKVLALFGLVISMVVCDDDDDDTIAENIVEPCKDSDNLTQCVREFFGKYMDCTVVENSNDEPVVFEGKHWTYAPRMNATISFVDTKVSNLNGKIERFYVNKASTNLVFSVEFEGITVDSKEAQIIIHRRSREPAYIYAHIYGTVPAVLTAVVPAANKDKVTKDKLKKTASVSAYLTHREFDFKIEPYSRKNIGQEDVEFIIGTGLKMITDIPTNVKELFLTGAPDLFAVYLQSHICDFGIATSELY